MTAKRWGVLTLLAGLALAGGCGSVYYGAMEKVGVDKRDTLVERVKAARDAARVAEQQCTNAVEQFRGVTQVPSTNLQTTCDRLSDALRTAEDRTATLHSRIRGVADVSEAVLSDKRNALKEYHSAALRESMEQKLAETSRRHADLIAALQKAAGRLEPVTGPLGERLLLLKQGLSAKSAVTLPAWPAVVNRNVNLLIHDTGTAIAEADRFLAP